MIIGLLVLFLIFFLPILFIYSEFFIRPIYLKNPENVGFIKTKIYLFVTRHQFIILLLLSFEFISLYIFTKIF